MIAAENVAWHAGDVPIITDVTAVFEAGRLTAILGPNGSGKTTLLHVLAGLRNPANGRVLLDGQPLSGLAPRQRARQISLVEQHPSTELELTVGQIVGLGRIPHIGPWPGARDRDPGAIGEAMEVAGIGHLAGRCWGTLSGGERQRVHLARALAQRPKVLLLDEPTNHLDLSHQLSFLETLASLDICVVAVLHDLDLAAAYCTDVLVMHDGRAIASGETAEVLTTELIGRVFEVSARVHRDDRLRVNWSRI